VVSREQQSIAVRNDIIEELSDAADLGLGVRVVAGGWGFVGISELSPDRVRAVAREAVRIGRASATLSRDGAPKLAPVEPQQDEWRSQFRVDPFEVPLEDKVSLLIDVARIMRQQEEVRVAQGRLSLFRTRKWFASSEGAEISQELLESGGLISATALRGPLLQERSYPSALEGFHGAGGYEVVEQLDLTAGAEEASREAVQLLEAPVCPSERTTLVIGGSQMALQVHESCGHPTELDRVFGTEKSYAGESFLTTEKLDTFRYGSPHVNIAADATVPGGLGTFGYDDEGVPGQRTELIREGIFSGYLSSRETAARLGGRSGGTMRAESWNRLPLIRMTNINLEPGDFTLDELIEETQHGYYCDFTKSWSIDDLRLNFQFATEAARRIEKGSLGPLVRDLTYQGVTPEFWGSCDGVANRKAWRLWGVLNCGKGEPSQTMHVGHGTSPARFQNVRVGVLESEAKGDT
jgi:TldD protein